MGMFDSVYVDRELLPITDAQYKKIDTRTHAMEPGSDVALPEFQTKDLDNALTRFHIRSDGTLWFYTQDGWVNNYVPAPTSTKLQRALGAISHSPVNPHWKEVEEYPAEFSFYTSYGKSGWLELNARFSERKLVEITITRFETHRTGY